MGVAVLLLCFALVDVSIYPPVSLSICIIRRLTGPVSSVAERTGRRMSWA